MPYPIITPSFFQELTDPKNPENANLQYIILNTPAAVEYAFPLNQEKVVRRLMQQKESLSFKMTPLKPEAEEEFAKKGAEIVEKFPILKHYWSMKTLTMNLLQDRRYSLDHRMWLLNYAYKTIQYIIENPDPNNKAQNDEQRAEILDRNVEGFIQSMLREENHDHVVEKYFADIKPNTPYGIADGISMLRTFPETEETKKLLTIICKHAGIPKGADSFQYDEELHKKIKDSYEEMFAFKPVKEGEAPAEDPEKIDRSYYMEQIMVNYIWTYCFPYADISVDLWKNFVFLNTLYNALKVAVSCYIYGSKTPDEDFVFVITAFDTGLRSIKGNPLRMVVESESKAQLSNNGDMAILSIS